MAASPRTLSRTAQRAPAQPRGRRMRFWRALLAGSAWAGTALAVALRLADGTAQQITDFPGLLGVLGVVAGLVAMNSLSFMLLLAARVPVIDRVLGQVRAARWHRGLGRVTVFGALAHVALVLTGTGWTRRDDLVAAAGSLWTRDLSLALAAAALLLPTTATSLMTRRSLRHEVWPVHVLSCTAVLLAIPHVISRARVPLPGDVQRIYWVVLLGAVGACLAWYRILNPLLLSRRHRLVLANAVHLAPDLLHLEFAGRNLDTLRAQGGQCFTWRLLTPQLWHRAQPFFLSAAPTNNRLRITLRVTDERTAELAAARPGTRVVFTGPHGAFTDASRTRNGLVLIGAGTGLVPVRSLLETTTAHPADTVVILRASRPEDLFLLDEFRELCDDRGITLHLMTGPRHDGRWVSIGYADHDLSTLVPNLGDSDVFVCGPDGFVGSVLTEARRLGVAAEQCHEERLTL
ncbi:ferric reductase-like transmembrane domain-containing protein [[Pseudopropionibacterium] massiliense]|uniref:ferric reductase-like transmembrane domain-containing protein n=1 Tax=[Pseudopropionibacterium] massiliense TaxID=2220000 RepID=UPI0013EF36B6|nr:ferredoxin reductase family protein [[Pseudopropionibacterium] massiliense]